MNGRSNEKSNKSPLAAIRAKYETKKKIFKLYVTNELIYLLKISYFNLNNLPFS